MKISHVFKICLLVVPVFVTMPYQGTTDTNSKKDSGWQEIPVIGRPNRKYSEMEKTKIIKVIKSDREWKSALTPEQYRVLRRKGTERPHTGKYDMFFEKGVYHCAACDNELFSSETKFRSGTGWPSFWEPISEESIYTLTDRSLFMVRTEVLCGRCDGHLGHVFDDGPKPTGLRYCMNSVALKFRPETALGMSGH